MKYYVTVTTVNSRAEKTAYVIDIDSEKRLTVDGEQHTIDFQSLSKDGFMSLLLDNRSVEGVIEEQPDNTWEVLIYGELYTVSVQDERAHRLAQARGASAHESGEATLNSPMPGIITKVSVKVGDVVKKQSTLLILESMKMENELRSPRDGVITHINVQAGQSVEKGYTLIVIGEAPPAV